MRELLLIAAVAATGCQHDVHSPFPPGLEPLEDNPIPPQTSGPYAETLMTKTEDGGFIHAYGRGYVDAPPGQVWAAMKTSQAVVAVCTTDQQTVTPKSDPRYELDFVVSYTVNNVVTVQWDDEWRFGTIDGTPDAPELAMVGHQKIDGSSFINRSEGTITVTPADGDDSVTDLAFVEHLDAIGDSDSDVLTGMNHDFGAILALTHGTAIPGCP
jgi:hypothetical protein|nr:hypothetical protein [Kofleriaceae bacterium]